MHIATWTENRPDALDRDDAGIPYNTLYYNDNNNNICVQERVAWSIRRTVIV